jgi:hypothetical protein
MKKKVKPGANLTNKPIIINHTDLERCSESIFRSNCPVCKEGLLPVRRNQKTLKLLKTDICMLCAQTVIYADFKTNPIFKEN